jgi:hypothetical protein
MNDDALCPEDLMKNMLVRIAQDQDGGVAEVGRVLGDFPNDPSLLFLYGSLAAGQRDYATACDAMRRAIDVAPAFHIARFQLGLLLLTSGEAITAQETWGPLHSLPSGHYLRVFVNGLHRLILDDFSEAVRLLEEGIALNHENAPMNRDMQMIVDEVRSKQMTGGPEGTSSVDLLLRQAALKPTKH